MSRLADYRSIRDDNLRQLIANHAIVLEGPLPLRAWPVQFVSMLAKIDGINQVRFDEYNTSEYRGLRDVERLKRTAVHINHVAHTCHRDESNQAIWSLRIEHFIISRFGAEVMW